MEKTKKICKYCSAEYESGDSFPLIFEHCYDACNNCQSIADLDTFVSQYDHNHKEKVWENKIHEKNMVKNNHDYGNGVTSYTLAKHKFFYRVEKRTKRVQAIIDKISFIRRYLYINLNPVFEILDSIYIKKDPFWDDSGNLIMYVHNCCFQEAVLKLRELLIDGSCKYSIRKIRNALLADSKYVFKEQGIYERLEFEESKDVMEERYEPFNIEQFVTLVDKALNENNDILMAMKDYRDNQFAHIDDLKNASSSKFLSYVNIKRMFALAKIIYDGFSYAVAPDKYATINVDSNICFSHLNELSEAYKKYILKTKRKD